MNTYDEWQAQFPQAAAALQAMHTATRFPTTPASTGKSEAWAQQQDRLTVARQGGAAWRNNVGATPARCGECGYNQRPIRYGLCNDSAALNKEYKSSDLIAAIPRVITAAMVGTTIAQFGSIESKRPGWVYTGTPREQAQQNWLTLIRELGGFATFSTGQVTL